VNAMAEGGPRFGLNVTAFEQAHPGWYADIGFEGFGWRARRRVDGRLTGPGLSARTLDELAELIDAGRGSAFYVLACRDCGYPDRPLIMPFSSAAKRGKWASEHTKATGHDRWFVKDQNVPEAGTKPGRTG
jgi:hypothetical protein